MTWALTAALLALLPERTALAIDRKYFVPRNLGL